MSDQRAQGQSPQAAIGSRLGAVREDLKGEVARRAAPERARSALAIAADQTPALPDAIRIPVDRLPRRVAPEQAEIERFRTVLGGRQRAIG
jgi:hypothetical protein